MKLTLVITYYEAPLMLREQVKYWKDYSKDVRIIIIDDHSVLYPAKLILNDVDIEATVELYRIDQDIFQNTFGARNLAFHLADDGEWIWNTDVDHVVPWESIAAFLDMQCNTKGYYYIPAREIVLDTEETKVIQRHSDTFILTKELYWKTGGYDEDLTGFYFNGPATRFRNALKHIAKGVPVNHGVKTLFYSTDLIKDASPISNQEKQRFIGISPFNKKPSVLKFNWERIL